MGFKWADHGVTAVGGTAPHILDLTTYHLDSALQGHIRPMGMNGRPVNLRLDDDQRFTYKAALFNDGFLMLGSGPDDRLQTAWACHCRIHHLPTLVLTWHKYGLSMRVSLMLDLTTAGRPLTAVQMGQIRTQLMAHRDAGVTPATVWAGHWGCGSSAVWQHPRDLAAMVLKAACRH